MSDEPDEPAEADVAAEASEEDVDADADAADEAETSADPESADGDAEDTDEETSETATEPETEAEDDADAEDAGLADGDFVRLAYTARTVEDDQLVDTTDPDVAEEEGVEDQGTFEPRVIVLGSGHLFDVVEDDLRGKSVGDEGSVVVSAAEGFGEYDDEAVRTVSADKIDEDDRYPGAMVQVDGQQGTLETIVGGRARVNFNHPLAGKDIEYTYEILDVVEDDLEQAKGLLDMFLDLDLEMWIETDEVEETRIEEPDEDDEDAEPETVTETVEKRTLYVEATPQLTMNQQWMFQKQQIAQEVISATDIDRIVVQEVLDGGGMMGGLGGMMGGMGGDIDEADLEDALDDADIDADELAEEIE